MTTTDIHSYWYGDISPGSGNPWSLPVLDDPTGMATAKLAYLFGNGPRPDGWNLETQDIRAEFEIRYENTPLGGFEVASFGAFVSLNNADGSTSSAMLDADRPSAFGVTINPETGALTARPTTGDATVFIIAHSGFGHTRQTDLFTFPRVHPAPETNRAPEQTRDFADSTIHRGDAVAIDLNDYFTDANGDDLTFNVDVKIAMNSWSSSTMTLKHIGVSCAGLKLNPYTGMLTGRPSQDVTITVRAHDGGATTESNSFTITTQPPAEQNTMVLDPVDPGPEITDPTPVTVDMM